MPEKLKTNEQKNWKHVPKHSQMDGNFWFDGSVWTAGMWPLHANELVGQDQWAWKSQEMAHDVREYLKNLALENNGLGSLHLFEFADRRKFLAFAILTKKEVREVMNPKKEALVAEELAKQREDANWNATLIDPNLTVLITPEFIECRGGPNAGWDPKEKFYSHLDEALSAITYYAGKEGSGFPTNEQIQAVLDGAS